MGFKFFQRLIDVLFRPGFFYKKAQKRLQLAEREKQFKLAMWFVLTISVLTALIVGLISFFGSILLGTIGYSAMWLPLKIILSAIISFVVSFIWAAIIHLFVKIFKGQEEYKETYRAVAYAYAPYFPLTTLGALLGLIPVAGTFIQGTLVVITLVWEAVLLVLGIKYLQKLSTGKAVASILLPYVILILLAIIMAVVLVLLFGAALFASLI